MREITTHHDGHGLNESIHIKADEPGPGGASHCYEAEIGIEGGCWARVGTIQFQEGPRNVEGSTPGMTDISLLAIVRDRLECFQAGEYPCSENEDVLYHIEAAMRAIKARADEREARGVLGTYQK